MLAGTTGGAAERAVIKTAQVAGDSSPSYPVAAALSRTVAGIAAVFAVLLAAGAADAAEDAPRGFLRIAVWNFASDGAPPLPPAADGRPKGESVSPPPPGYRHTFGAERRSPAPTAQSVAVLAGIDADIFLVHGVSDVRTARRAFPATSYLLIVSRQSLYRSGQPQVGLTAVAVRRRADVRVIGQEHIEPDDPAAGNASGRAWATAVRMIVDTYPLWMVAVDRVSGCPEPASSAPPCPGANAPDLERLALWRRQHQADGDGVVLGGVLGPTLRDARSAAATIAGARDRQDGPAPSGNGDGGIAAVRTAGSDVYLADDAAACGTAGAKTPRADVLADLAAAPGIGAPKSARLAGADGAGTPGGCHLTVDLALPRR